MEQKFKAGDKIRRIGGNISWEHFNLKTGDIVTFRSYSPSGSWLGIQEYDYPHDQHPFDASNFELVSQEIEVGDTVECIKPDENLLTEGKKYIVTRLNPGYIHVVGNDGQEWSYFTTRFKLISKANKQKTMATYQVDEAFIKEAHKAACYDWKKKLEAKFPTLFIKYTPKVGEILWNGTTKDLTYKIVKMGYKFHLFAIENNEVRSEAFSSIEDLIAKHDALIKL